MHRGILISLPAFALLCSAQLAWSDEIGQRLTGEEIIHAIADHQVNAVTSKGKTWSAVFKSDGSVEYGGGGKGTWRVDGDKFCDHPAGDKEYCGGGVTKLGDKLLLLRPDGSKAAELTVK